MEGWVYSDLYETHLEVGGTYQHIRSSIEGRGDVGAEVFCEVMDLDRAILALRRLNPVAALIVTLYRDGWSYEEINHTVGQKLRTPTARLIDKSVAFISAYLSGADEDQLREAYRRGRRRGV